MCPPADNANEKTSLLQISRSSSTLESENQPLRAAFNLWSVAWVGLGVALGMLLVHQHSGMRPSTNYAPLHSMRKSGVKKYDRFQTLGFQIFTGGALQFLDAYDEDTGVNSTVLNPECVGRRSKGVLGGWEPMCYMGLEDHIQRHHTPPSIWLIVSKGGSRNHTSGRSGNFR